MTIAAIIAEQAEQARDLIARRQAAAARSLAEWHPWIGVCDECGVFRVARAAGWKIRRRLDARCCHWNRLRHHRCECELLLTALDAREPELTHLHAVTLVVLGDELTDDQHADIRSALLRRLTRHRARPMLACVSELGRLSGRWHDHGVLAASGPIDSDELGRLYADAVAAAGIDRPTRTKCEAVEDIRDWVSYMHKVGRFARKAGPLIDSPLTQTWGARARLFKPLGGKAAALKRKPVTTTPAEDRVEPVVEPAVEPVEPDTYAPHELIVEDPVEPAVETVVEADAEHEGPAPTHAPLRILPPPPPPIAVGPRCRRPSPWGSCKNPFL